MASIFDTLKSLGRGLVHYVSEGAARAVASFAERYDRNASLVYQQRSHLPRGRTQQLARQHRTGERMMASTMRGAGGLAWPASWTQNRSLQVQMFRRWPHVFIHRLCSTIATLPPRLAYVRPRRKKPRGAGGTVEKHAANRRHGRAQRRRRKAYYEARYKKSLHAIRPHEEIEDVGDDHPLARLLKKPNAWVQSPGILWYQLCLFLYLTGNAYLWMVPDRAFGRPLEAWVIPAHWVWGPQLNAAGATEYKIMPFTGGFGSFTIPADEIVHFHFPNPLNPLDGWSPTQAGAPWIDVSESIDDSRYWTMKQGTQSSVALELGPKYDPDDEDIEAIGAKFMARYASERNAGMPIIPPPDVKVVPLSIAPKDMSFESGFEQLRDAQSALYGCPKGAAGITDPGSDRALWGERAVLMDNLKPLLQYIGETFTASVCIRWDDQLKLWWEDPTPQDPQQVNSDLSADGQHGIRTPNEWRSVRGLEPIENPLYDEPWVPQGFQPLSVAEKQWQQQSQQAAMPQPPAPGGDGAGGGSPDLAALVAGAGQQTSKQAQSDQQTQAGKFAQLGDQDTQADAQDAALDVNDQAWGNRQGAVKKAHEYNARLAARGSRWRLEEDAASQRWRVKDLAAAPAALPARLAAAGLAVVADDTGRAILHQRSLDDDANGGKWEFPGGHINAGEKPRDAAVREWQEETGLPLPRGGRFSGVWNSGNGVYRGYVYRVPTEDALDLFARDPSVNPDGDAFEALAWVSPEDFENHNLRPELLADLPLVHDALRTMPGAVVKSWSPEQAEKHPHAPAGSSHGGEFVSTRPGGQIGTLKAPKSENRSSSRGEDSRSETVAREQTGSRQSLADATRDWKQSGVRSEAFRDWFGDWESDPEEASKVLTSSGKPAIVFSGQPKGIDVFSAAERSELPSSYAFFSDRRSVAELYSGDADSEKEKRTDFSTGRDGQVYAVYLNIRRPWDLDVLSAEEWVHASVDDPSDWAEDAVDYLRQEFQNPEALIQEEANRLQVDLGDLDLQDRGDSREAVERLLPHSGREAFPEWQEAVRHAKIKAFKEAVGYDGDSTDPAEIIRETTQEWPLRGYTMQDALMKSPSGKMAVMYPKMAKRIIERNAYDGYVHTDEEVGGTTWIIFRPEQVKSAYNRGTFDSRDANINKSWDAGKHPRGGDQHFPQRFSKAPGGGAGSASNPNEKPTRRPEEIALPLPEATRPHPGPEQQDEANLDATRDTAGLARPTPADYARVAPAESKPPSVAERSSLHDALESSRMTHASRQDGGVNASFILSLEDGSRGVFKPRGGEREDIRAGVPNGTNYRREVAASRLAEVLGLDDLVPTTVFREQVGLGVGSMQHFVPEADPPVASDQPFDGGEDAARAAAFDYLLGHLDRHAGNWLLKNGKLVLIDNGTSLPTSYLPRDFFNIEFWTHATRENLPLPDRSGWRDKWPDVQKELSDCGIEPAAIELARQRFDALVSAPADAYFSELPGLLPGMTDMLDTTNACDLADRYRQVIAYYGRAAREAHAAGEMDRHREMMDAAVGYRRRLQALEELRRAR